MNFEDLLETKGLVEPVQTNTMTCPGNVDGVVISIIDDGAIVHQGDVVCIIEDKELSKDYNASLVNLENAKAELSKTKADLDMQYALLEAQVKSNEAESDIANLDSLEIKFSSVNQGRIKELELEKVSIEKEKLRKKLKSLAIINNSEIKKTELLIQRLTINVQSTKERLDALTVKATQDGMANRAIHWITDRKIQPGDPVWNGMPLIVIPELTKMKVKIYASEVDYKRIEIGDSVEYSFDAMPDNKAWGKIQKKAPVGQPVKEDSKVKTFEIEASMDKALVIPGPDLTVNCTVILKQIKDTLVIPQVTVFDEDSMNFVYVKKGKAFEMRQILTGTSSQKETVVSKGLKRNEIISLIKPNSEFISSKKLLSKPVNNKKKKTK